MARRWVGGRVEARGAEPPSAPNEGQVVNGPEGPVAVVWDDAGQAHAVSAVCTHLGCLVEWNGADRTWDCPCHGSRFEIDGTVRDGPAVAPLEPRAPETWTV